MKILNYLVVISLIIISFKLDAHQQSDEDGEKWFFELHNAQYSDIKSVNYGDFKSMHVKISNFSKNSINVHFPPGGIFINKENTEQNLMILFYEKYSLNSGETKEVKISTACIDPKKKAPRKGRDNWDYSYDKKVGDLIYYYHQNRSLVELATGSEYHDTKEKRHNFLQMCIWVYYNAEKKQIIDFATKYIFNGDKQLAISFVDVFYPLAVSFINIYKAL